MATTEKNQFTPDYAVHPGSILREILESRNIKQVDLAQRCDLSEKKVSRIVNEKAPISAQLAMRLERVLGMSADIWNGLMADYQLHQTRQKERDELSEAVSWAKKFPVDEMVGRGWLPDGLEGADLVDAVLRFFDVGSINGWTRKWGQLGVSYRHSGAFQSSEKALAVWLQAGEHLARNIPCAPFDKSEFDQALDSIRDLTTKEPEVFEARMRELASSCGIALALVPELEETRAYGATRWLSPEKAFIALSLRHKWEGQFWFSFFHEAAHIALHGKREAFVDEKPNQKETADQEALEEEADEFAQNLLIPQDAYEQFVSGQAYKKKTNVRAFARRVGIAPGIVVGRLQHDGYLPWNWMNDLKRKFTFVDSTRA